MREKHFIEFRNVVSVFLFLFFVILPFVNVGCEHEDENNDRSSFHPEFQIKGSLQLSPPMIYKPIHECARVVKVYGFMPHAKVKVYSNGNELIGEAEPDFGFAEILLTREVCIGEKISATQTVENFTSGHTLSPANVSSYLPGGFNKPEVGKDLYDCGVIVPVGNLVESVRVNVLADQHRIGSAEAAGTWKAVWTQPLVEDQRVTAIQVACEDDPQKEIKSPESNPVMVKPAPRPIQAPEVGDVIIGNDTVDLYGLYVGAIVQVYDNGNSVGGGAATGSANWCPIDPPISNNSVITATQKLCEGNTSIESEPGDVVKVLRAPMVVGPICDGALHVVIRDTVINANVFVTSNGAIVGYGGAVAGDLILGIPNGLHANDSIRARQYMQNTISPLSNEVIVQGMLEAPVIRISGDEPFFIAEAGEQQVGGPVFCRGKGSGPLIKVQTCCDDSLTVKIEKVNGAIVTKITMTEQFPGYYTGRWDWGSNNNWNIPSKIPVGQYRVNARAGCGMQASQKKFYVIFDPAEVTAPSRFAFNEIGVWFYSGWGKTYSTQYYLHPDDKRIFEEAIRLIDGEISAYKASEKIMNWTVPHYYSPDYCHGGGLQINPNKRFVYSICTSENDVLDLLARSDRLAQCADSACIFTAMLRAVGIPSHPATADAAREYGEAGWGFDTWTEARIDGPSGEKWYVSHPHEGRPWTHRLSAGTWGVASKAFNDIVIMANKNWVWSHIVDDTRDVGFKYDTDCKEPNRNFSHKKDWVEHMCVNHPDGDYWGKGHWRCSPAYLRNVLIKLDKEIYRVGETMRFKVEVKNENTVAMDKSLVVSIAIDDPLTKIYPDERIVIGKKTIQIKAGESISFDFKYRIPFELSSASEFSIIAKLEDESIAVPFNVETLYESRLALTNRVKVGSSFEAKLQIHNRSKQVIEKFNVKLELPYSIRVEKNALKKQLSSLEPGENVSLRWLLHAVSPSEAAGVVLRIESSNGGNSIVRDGLEIKGPPDKLPESVVLRRKGD